MNFVFDEGSHGREREGTIRSGLQHNSQAVAQNGASQKIQAGRDAKHNKPFFFNDHTWLEFGKVVTARVPYGGGKVLPHSNLAYFHFRSQFAHCPF